jgi:Ca-activated chloride channel homolog
MRNKFSFLLLFFFLIGISGCAPLPPVETGTEVTKPLESNEPKVDDWSFDADDIAKDYSRGTGGMVKSSIPAMPVAMESAMAPMGGRGGGNMGFAVGGAKDVNNFRENIKNGYLPIPTDITYEGLFYGYFFDTGKTEECTKLFCPSYSTAVSKDPLSGESEYYLSVGLNSGIKESDFQRKKLNLVVVMDISGSMGSPFDQYYYDRFGNKVENEDKEGGSGTKMEIASKSVVSLLDHLKDDDRFGLVLFDDSSYVAKPLTRVGKTDMKKIKDHIMELQERGGTYMEAGMKDGTKLLNELSESDPDQYENRIIFITDAMPNIGDTSEEGLMGMLEDNADNHIYTTFVGVGVDFNTELVEVLTKIRGANYYSVHSSKEFKKVLDDDFDYMVTPLVFDLKLQLEADGWEIEKVYGSPEADEATGEIMKVNTLFPSKTEGGETKGGIIILKLNKTGESGKLTLKTSYEDRNGKKDSDEKNIIFRDKQPDYYDNNGIRKAILLVRYANLMKDWLIDEIRWHDNPRVPCPPIIVYETGIRCPEYRCIPPMPPLCEIRLGEWERQSVELNVSRDYKKVFRDFAKYFEDEIKKIGDDTLKQEVDTLDLLQD